MPKKSQNEAATLIQKNFRAYKERKKYNENYKFQRLEMLESYVPFLDGNDPVIEAGRFRRENNRFMLVGTAALRNIVLALDLMNLDDLDNPLIIIIDNSENVEKLWFFMNQCLRAETETKKPLSKMFTWNNLSNTDASFQTADSRSCPEKCVKMMVKPNLEERMKELIMLYTLLMTNVRRQKSQMIYIGIF